MRETKHLYLRQSALKDNLDAWIDSKTDWPVLTTSIAKKWLHDGEGLRDRGITRDLDWGIPVRRGDAEWPGMEGKVFYVWFDAPIEYIACADEWAKANGLDDAAWQRWWRTDMGADDVRYTQFMGKDNVPFHTLSFPATILGSGEPWKMVDHLKSFNYLNYDGGQFSTSQGRGIFMDQALELLPADYWRWWLLSHAPESSDSEFTWENFQTSVNKDLADVLGNFVSRITKFCRSKFGETVPDGGAYGPAEQELIATLAQKIARYEELMEAMEVRKSAQELRGIWVAGNEYLQTVAPWSTFKTDPDRAAVQTRMGLNLIRLYAVLSAPFIPEAARAMLEAIKAQNAEWPDEIAPYLEALPRRATVLKRPKFSLPRSATKIATAGRNVSPEPAANAFRVEPSTLPSLTRNHGIRAQKVLDGVSNALHKPATFAGRRQCRSLRRGYLRTKVDGGASALH